MSGVSESKALEEICKTMQHSVTSFFVKSSNEFDTAINYIATIDDYVDDEDEKEQICIHISCHGNNDGLALGKDFLMWEEVANSLLPLLKLQRLKKPIYLAISACGTDNQKISSAIRKIFNKEKIKPPKFIFVINQKEVGWNDALLNWTILYHQIDYLNGAEDLRDLLTRIVESGFGKLKYYRWDVLNKKYFTFYGEKVRN
ncbi:hypothetical protein [Solibacillus cecembensis]|uniref:hypothetical protein n=1 Tax=Solibacillus cecembensis TaxID=459347 RepID=UPI003D08624A